MKKSFCMLIVLILLTNCGMMFKNKPTPTKIINNTNSEVVILDSNKNPIEVIKPNNEIVVEQKNAMRIRGKSGSMCKIPRTTNGGIVAGDILASLFVPLWPISIPLIWIGETTGGYLRDNVGYIEVSTCFEEIK